jgi:hypothetical protein
MGPPTCGLPAPPLGVRVNPYSLLPVWYSVPWYAAA